VGSIKEEERETNGNKRSQTSQDTRFKRVGSHQYWMGLLIIISLSIKTSS
jgi:hypothetical protein